MQENISVKKARAIVVTIALIVATNFAISHAASISQPAPRPTSSFAADAAIPVWAPRPTSSFAKDGLSPTPSAKLLM